MSSGALSETMAFWTLSKQNMTKKWTETLCLLGPLRENNFPLAIFLIELLRLIITDSKSILEANTLVRLCAVYWFV
jgi:hypothetical protein